MIINFDFETKGIIAELKLAHGYLDCENIITRNIKKHMVNDIEINVIEGYLKKLQKYFEDKTVINKGNDDCVNYKYAAGFLTTINATPYWHRWIKTSE
jgi:hypothetical protein